jgi:hypothetical protein
MKTELSRLTETGNLAVVVGEYGWPDGGTCPGHAL